MATPQVNEFTSFELSDHEEREGNLLAPLNFCVIQNHRARIAAQLLNLEESTLEEFNRQRIFLKGQIDILNLILASHKASMDEAQELVRQQSREM